MNADVRAYPPPSRAIEQRVAAHLVDARDLPFVWLMLQCGAWQLVSIALFFTGSAAVYWAPVYWALWGAVFLDRFILMLHCTSHRALFKDRRLNQVSPWAIGPFFGQTPESYFSHHMGMHHPENNLGDDLSSTMRYDRGRFSHWLHYFGSFLFAGLPALARYHRERGNKKLLRRLLMGECAFWTVVAGLALFNWQATLIVFVVPVLAVRALMMAGNWGQHAFVDGADPANPYRNSISCINLRYNRRCFNDGYHILHHLRPRTHYTEYAAEFEAGREMTWDAAVAFALEGHPA